MAFWFRNWIYVDYDAIFFQVWECGVSYLLDIFLYNTVDSVQSIVHANNLMKIQTSSSLIKLDHLVR